MTMENTKIKNRESKARKQLKDQGYTLEKRTNNVDSYHSGCYRILNSWTGNIEGGAEFDMTIEDVEKFVLE